MASSTDYTADQIQVLEGLEAVRRRPDMYIGGTDAVGLHHLVREVVDNSIDEIMAGQGDRIEVVIHADGSISVEDNGRGIPVDLHAKEGRSALEVVMTKLHAGGKFGGDASGYKVSGGLHGVGVSCVNALSEWCVVEVKRDRKLHRIRFERGRPVAPVEEVGKAKGTGTYTHFQPDPEIFETIEYSFDRLSERLRDLAYLNGGVHITLLDLRHNDEETGEPKRAEFHYKGGVREFVEYLNETKNPLHDPIYIRDDRDGISVELALQYNDGYLETILCFANCIHTTEGGTHLSGLKTALTRVLNSYARDKNLLKERDKNFSGEDVREGLAAVISVRLPDPKFESQTKIRLTNTEVEGMTNSIVGEALATYLDEHPSVGRAIVEKAVTAARAREAARKAADLIKRKSALEVAGMPGSLWDCSSRRMEECELFIVEGDSAAGTAKAGRNSRFQAILPLGGKPLNVEKHRIDKILGHEHIRTMVSAVGTGIADPAHWEEIHAQILQAEEERRQRAEAEAKALLDGVEPGRENAWSEATSGNGNGTANGANGKGGNVGNFDLDRLRYNRIIIMADADVDGSHIRTLLLTFFLRYLRPLVELGHVYIAQPPLFGVKVGNRIRYAQDEAQRDAILDELKGRRGIHVQRYKGLGEMNAEQLAVTTMNPASRRLLQIKVEDAVAADHMVSTLMGDAVEPRKNYIVEHARRVRNLDI